METMIIVNCDIKYYKDYNQQPSVSHQEQKLSELRRQLDAERLAVDEDRRRLETEQTEMTSIVATYRDNLLQVRAGR